MAIHTDTNGLVAERVQFSQGDASIKAYVARPADEAQHPAVIVIHEAFGLDEHHEDVARRFAHQGYIALAIDLFSRTGLPEWKTYQDLAPFLEKFSDSTAIEDVRAATHYLRSRTDVLSDSIGVIGFCMGGLYSLLSACRIPELSAAIDCYGRVTYPVLTEAKPKSPIDYVSDLHCPLLAFFGAKDKGIPPAQAELLRVKLGETGKTFDLHIYEDAGHAFFNDSRGMFVEEAALDGWKKVYAFFANHLQ